MTMNQAKEDQAGDWARALLTPETTLFFVGFLVMGFATEGSVRIATAMMATAWIAFRVFKRSDIWGILVFLTSYYPVSQFLGKWTTVPKMAGLVAFGLPCLACFVQVVSTRRVPRTESAREWMLIAFTLLLIAFCGLTGFSASDRGFYLESIARIVLTTLPVFALIALLRL